MHDQDWRPFIADMITYGQHARAHANGLDEAGFKADLKTQHAVARCVEIIGEAAKHVPEAVRERAPDTPWRDIIGARNVLAHAYARVDPAILWALVNRELAVMERSLSALLDKAPKPDAGSDSR
ncbi:HepT-like ribonuclease domain-containing protein [Alkalicaulis satelles]|nr:DUF86 domain-containing protein [Alkalicaulis satelles]